MNITDIDDKIIKRARQNYLFEKYLEEEHSNDEIFSNTQAISEKLRETLAVTQDQDKKAMVSKMQMNVLNVVAELKKKFSQNENVGVKEV